MGIAIRTTDHSHVRTSRPEFFRVEVLRRGVGQRNHLGPCTDVSCLAKVPREAPCTSGLVFLY